MPSGGQKGVRCHSPGRAPCELNYPREETVVETVVLGKARVGLGGTMLESQHLPRQVHTGGMSRWHFALVFWPQGMLLHHCKRQRHVVIAMQVRKARQDVLEHYSADYMGVRGPQVSHLVCVPCVSNIGS